MFTKREPSSNRGCPHDWLIDFTTGKRALFLSRMSWRHPISIPLQSSNDKVSWVALDQGSVCKTRRVRDTNIPFRQRRTGILPAVSRAYLTVPHENRGESIDCLREGLIRRVLPQWGCSTPVLPPMSPRLSSNNSLQYVSQNSLYYHRSIAVHLSYAEPAFGVGGHYEQLDDSGAVQLKLLIPERIAT